MVSHREFEGATLQEALGAASAALGIEEPDISFEILETGRRGVFGLGVRKVRIRVRPDESAANGEPDGPAAPAGDRARRERPSGRRRRRRRGDGPSRQAQSAPSEPREEPEPDPADPARDEVAQRVEGDMRRMLELMSLELTVSGQGLESGVRLELGGADRKLLLQKDAELISSLQFLLNRMSRRAWPGSGRIQLACDGFRSHRDDELVELAREVAQQVTQTGRAKRLHAMNPYERRLVHVTVREFEGLTTRSEGDGFRKRVRVSKK